MSAWVCVCVCVYYIPVLASGTLVGRWVAVFLGGPMYKRRKKKKKKRKIGVPCGDLGGVKYLPVRDWDDYWEVS